MAAKRVKQQKQSASTNAPKSKITKTKTSKSSATLAAEDPRPRCSVSKMWQVFTRLAERLKSELNGNLEISRDASAGEFTVTVKGHRVFSLIEKRPFPKLKKTDMKEVAKLVMKQTA